MIFPTVAEKSIFRVTSSPAGTCTWPKSNRISPFALALAARQNCAPDEDFSPGRDRWGRVDLQE
jgi:hypothetical protein